MLCKPIVWGHLYRIAEQAGVRLAERAAMDSFYYDGDSIASYSEPGTLMDPVDVLHEISHFIVATDEERLFPEYGMVARARTISRGISADTFAPYASRVTFVLTKLERNVRENATQVVNQALGLRYDIKSVFQWD